ncbi:MAG: MFS transporter [Sneathiella sp.]
MELSMAFADYSKKSVELKLTGYYTSFFAVYGIAIPLWPRWLEGQVSLEYIGLVLGASYWLKLIVVPLTSWISDVTGDRRRVLIALSLVVIAGLLLLPLASHWIWYAVIWGVAGAALSTGIPLSDGLTIRAVQLFGIEFGKVRRWGSISFIVVTLAVGALADQFGLDAIYSSILTMSVLLLVSAYFMPKIHTEPEATAAPFFKPLALPNFPLFLTAVALLLSTHAALYGFSAIYWKSVGYSNTMITVLWVVGVLAEIGIFSFAGKLIGRYGAMPMIIVAGVGCVIRWTMLASSTELPVLVGGQLLHGLTFALLYMSMIAYMTKRIPPSISASAQGLFDSLSMGVFFGLLTMGAGVLFEINPAYSFLLMTACSGIGVALSIVLLVRVRAFERVSDL